LINGVLGASYTLIVDSLSTSMFALFPGTIKAD
jgi:hypothetical protein